MLAPDMLSSNAAMGVTFFAAVASVVWSATVAWVYWLKHRYDPPHSLTQTVDVDRLAQLEATVESLTIEMERVSEAQRFTVKLLDERLPQPAAKPLGTSSSSGRVITPH